ncbi:MAG: phosphatidylserine decarboxylase [Bdellovibrionota bacterium]
MSPETRIVYWNRTKGAQEEEQVYGEKFVNWLYGTTKGRRLADGFLSGRAFSQIYGEYQSSLLSRHKIKPFIEKFQIPMSEYAEERFGSFNDFFIRKFRPGARTFVSDPRVLPAFSEARYLAWDKVLPEQTFPVKGSQLTSSALLGEGELSAPFAGGPLMIARLCPTDYHRYHYPDDGSTLSAYSIAGRLHSVNPAALRYKGEILCTNERRVSVLETSHFGKLAYIEVGAMCVGRIVQTHDEKLPFRRGDEKGYFLFGGSTVIVLGEKGRWKPSEDLLTMTSRGIETLVRLGDVVASVIQ